MPMIPLFRPGIRSRGAPRALAFAASMIVASAVTGCSSFGDGCGPCGGGLGSRLNRCSLFSGTGFGSRLFNHKSAGCGDGGCLGGDSCGGSPMPGVTGVPIPGPGPVITTPGEEIDLSPANIPGGPTTTSPPTTSTPKVGNQASVRANRARTGSTLARRSPTPAPAAVTPEPASGPAAGARSSSPADDVLANMPPIRPPVDRSEPVKPAATPSPPPPIEAEAISKPAAADPTVTAPVASADTPPKAAEAEYAGAPGISPFKPITPGLSAGGLPTAAGWQWLGGPVAYKTVLDLRDGSEDRSSTNAAANANGLRYISLPVSANKIDAELMKKFLEEINMASSRPLYFFDGDGRRAATLWYIKLVSVDKLTPQEALKQVHDIGSPDAELILASHAYLATLTAPANPEAEKPKASETTTVAPKAPEPTEPGAQVPSAATSASVEPIKDEPAVESVGWKPYAALLTAGLGVPLAFYGRSAFRDHVQRASLPAPTRSPKSLPPASGA